MLYLLHKRYLFMKNPAKIILIYLTVITVITGCNRPVTDLFPDDPELRPVRIYVVSHGWHVGIVLPSNEIFREYMPQNYHGIDYRFNEFGWGDRQYYMTENPGIWLALKGAFWPTLSVIHAAGFDRDVDVEFRGAKTVEIMLSEKGFDALCARLASDMAYDDEGLAVILDSGWYADSRFYASERRYFLPRTSNKWVARLLREAGAPITPFYGLTSGNVIYQSRKFGELKEN
ncbi:MAG: DUF2459 domain-containing protein [Balneolaceae bacterium]|nr:MAG: DUF2459 domain-containing protein [Balneolaceae bacterium]